MTDEIAFREPLDTDTEIRPHLHAILLVAAGGFLGTIARYFIGEAIPDWQGIPVGILTINLTGAFLLGLLIETLARSGPDAGWRRGLRFFVGTGVIGGFTTYSALTADTAILLHDGATGTAAIYSLGTVLAGVVTTAAGIWLARTLFTPRRTETTA